MQNVKSRKTLMAILTVSIFALPTLAAAAIDANGTNNMPAPGVAVPPPAVAPNGATPSVNSGRAYPAKPVNVAPNRQPEGNINSHQQMQMDKNTPPSNPGGTNNP
ncbi:MAG: hypothetical protein K0R14_533 [Burkholderiales bacterium]|nr:hypothetical protein [Burkholderiales bacterium]